MNIHKKNINTKMKKKNLIFAERSTMCGSSELKSAVVRRPWCWTGPGSNFLHLISVLSAIVLRVMTQTHCYSKSLPLISAHHSPNEGYCNVIITAENIDSIHSSNNQKKKTVGGKIFKWLCVRWQVINVMSDSFCYLRHLQTKARETGVAAMYRWEMRSINASC